MALKESGEMYLESIYVLWRANGEVRSVDVAEYMRFSKPSVSRAMSILKKDGYVTVDRNGAITLTPKGLSVAQAIYTRHTVLSRMLIELGVDEQTATEDACRIEHVISEKSFAAIQAHMEQARRRK